MADQSETYKRVLLEKKCVIQAKVDIIKSLVDQIQSETEWDIWFPAWEKIREGTRQMEKLLEKGMIR